uniref:Uncharacterized protein n=1 Tax=Anthurium amnicola TaxID=1678845 RepID=A0A1D1YJZ8_9ARAE
MLPYEKRGRRKWGQTENGKEIIGRSHPKNVSFFPPCSCTQTWVSFPTHFDHSVPQNKSKYKFVHPTNTMSDKNRIEPCTQILSSPPFSPSPVLVFFTDEVLGILWWNG